MGSSEECTSANCSQCGVWSGVGQGQQGQEWLPSVWGPSLALPVTQWLVNRVMHLSAFVPLICLSGRDKAGGGDARLGSIVPGCCQTVPICPSFSLLRDCLFCHYFLAAGGSSGNLVNLLTSNCPLLPRSLNKQNGGGGEASPPNYKSHGEKDPGTSGSLHFYCLQPVSRSDFQLLLVWDVWEAVDALPVFLPLPGWSSYLGLDAQHAPPAS